MRKTFFVVSHLAPTGAAVHQSLLTEKKKHLGLQAKGWVLNHRLACCLTASENQMRKIFYTPPHLRKRLGKKRSPAPEPLGCGCALLFWGALLWLLQDQTGLDLMAWVADQLARLTR